MPDTEGSLAAWHDFLLRLAGVLPDDLICEARAWLADGLQVDVAQALALAAVAAGTPVRAADELLMMDVLEAADEDLSALIDLETRPDDDTAPLLWSFSPVRPEAIRADGGPLLLDATTAAGSSSERDHIDLTAVTAAEVDDRVVAVWRAWRTRLDGLDREMPRRVFILSVSADGAEMPEMTAQLQARLIAAGENDPQVEVCSEEADLPDYQSAAWSRSALLWAAEPAEAIHLARVFDYVDPDHGPAFDSDHPMIENDDEIALLLDYLENATPVLVTSSTIADVADDAHPDVVPLTFRTDGTWVWTEAVSYYLKRHRLAPEARLLAHVRSTVPMPPRILTDVGVYRVLSFLEHFDAEPAWVFSPADEFESDYVPT